MEEGLRSLVGGGSLVLLFVFSLAEAALQLLSRAKLEEKTPGGEDRERVRHRLSDLLALKVTARTLRIVSFVIFVAVCATFVDWSVQGMGGLLPVTLVAVPVTLLLAEVVPRGIVASHPEGIVRWTLPILYPFSKVLWPIASLSTGIARLLHREPVDGPRAMEEDIRTAAEEAEREGVLAKEDRAMIEKIMEFRDVQVNEVMTPRTDLFCIEVETSMEETMKIAKRTSHSRIPVYSGNRDTIVGILYLKDLLRQIDNGDLASVTLRAIMRKPLFIPETKFVSDLLKEFQASKIHIAIVVDEYGGTSGIVTIEDLLEEIVGEIQDEYDAEEEVPLRRIAEDTVDVDAKFHIDELNRELGLDLPEGDGFETLGGFVFSQLGKVPRVGENFRHGSVEFTVLAADERRINRLKLVITR